MNELWSLYIAGPDDLVAMPSKAVAEAVARNFNAVWDRYGAERDIKVHAVAHVEPWMHGKAAHTKDLREHFHEYAELVLDEETPPSAEPAQHVDRVSVPTPTSIDRRHPNQAYVTVGFDTESDCILFIKACGAGPSAALAHPRPPVTPERRDSDLHASAPDQHHEVARAVWEHMNRRSAPGVIMSMAYTAVLHALSNAAPTVEQAGEAVEPKWPGPWNGHHFPVDAIAKVFGKAAFEAATVPRLSDPKYTEIGIFLLQQLGAKGFGICRDQPRPVGVQDGWHKIGFIELPALARLMEGGKQSETLFVTPGGYKPQDVYVKLAAAPAPAPAPAKAGEA
jgi:hypothetical protein